MTSLPIYLPSGFSPNVNTGDPVTVGQIIASSHNKDLEVINIPKVLNIKVSKAKKTLLKSPGDSVSVGDVIAVKKNLFGTKKTLLKSNSEGTILRYERISGNLVIKTTEGESAKDIVSPIEGIVGMCNNEKILINTDKNVLKGKKSAGGEGQGERYILEVDDMYRIDARAIGKIIIGHKLNRDILLKGIGMGAAGLIGTEIEDDDLEHIKEKKFEIPVIEVEDNNWAEIVADTNKKMFIDANTQTIIFLSL